jgi:hypothetical protein
MPFRDAFDPIRALKSAFQVISQSPAAIILGGFLLWICDVARTAIPHPKFAIDRPAEELDNIREFAHTAWQALAAVLTGLTLVWLAFAFAFAIAAWLFRCVVFIGFAGTVEKTLERGNADTAGLFDARGRWASMALTRIVCALLFGLSTLPGIAVAGIVAAAIAAGTDKPLLAGLVAGTIVLCYIPIVVYIGLGLSLAGHAVAIEDMRTNEAIVRSWHLVRGHRWSLLLFWIVMALLDVLCCCLLFGPTMVTETAAIDGYLRLVKGADPSLWVRRTAAAG